MAELWKEFLAKHELQLCSLARQRYREAGTEWFSVFGSPMDFCEDFFLHTFDKTSVFVAHEKGTVLRLESDLDRGRSQLFSKMSVFKSTLAARDPNEAGENDYWLTKMGSSSFKPWPNALSTSTEWCKFYPVPNDYVRRVGPEPFHTLPIAFERFRFIIPDVSPPWAIDLIDEHYLPKVMNSFGGSALCLDLDGATRWRAKYIANPSFLKNLETPPNSPKAGRPSKQDDALGRYRQLFPNLRSVPVMSTTHAVTEAFAIASRESAVKFTPHSAKHCIGAERDKRPLTQLQRKAWSETMGHENEQITERYYGKLTDEERFEVMENIGENVPGGSLILSDEEKIALFDGILEMRRGK